MFVVVVRGRGMETNSNSCTQSTQLVCCHEPPYLVNTHNCPICAGRHFQFDPIQVGKICLFFISPHRCRDGCRTRSIQKGCCKVAGARSVMPRLMVRLSARQCTQVNAAHLLLGNSYCWRESRCIAVLSDQDTLVEGQFRCTCLPEPWNIS